MFFALGAKQSVNCMLAIYSVYKYTLALMLKGFVVLLNGRKAEYIYT